MEDYQKKEALIKKDRKIIEETIGYKFKKTGYLTQAFIRRSWAQKHDEEEDNEILEFLGDAVLGLLTTKALISDNMIQSDKGEFLFPEGVTEGTLTQNRVALVEGKKLAACIKRLELDKYMLSAHTDDQLPGYAKKKRLADLFEAILGAVTLDSNWNFKKIDVCMRTMLNYEGARDFGFAEESEYLLETKQFNYLKEKVQKKRGMELSYYTLPTFLDGAGFEAQVIIGAYGQKQYFRGVGKTKETALEKAAVLALGSMHLMSQEGVLKSDAAADSSGHHHKQAELSRDSLEPVFAVIYLNSLYMKKQCVKPVYTLKSLTAEGRGGMVFWRGVCRFDNWVPQTSDLFVKKKLAKQYAALKIICYHMSWMDIYAERLEKEIEAGRAIRSG